MPLSVPAADAARVVVTGGGTAGHVVPALPVIEALRGLGCPVDFIGSKSRLERDLIEPLGVPYHGIRTGKLRRYLSFENLLDCFRIPVGIWQAWRKLGRLRPDVVFSKGGYVSFPVVVGAWLRRIAVVAHESDLTPGLANRLSVPFVKAVCVNFETTTFGKARVAVTGTPLRSALIAGDPVRGRACLGLGSDRPLLLVVGGSLGAERINEVVRGCLPRLLADYAVAHVCGAGKLDAAWADEPGYVQLEYVADGWGDIIAAADLVVSRAGANALYEWLVLGKPHLLVPLPETASRGDQVDNAAYAEGCGYSLVMPEHELNSETLVAAVAKLAALAPAIRERLAGFQARDSTALIVAELERAVGRNLSGS